MRLETEEATDLCRIGTCNRVLRIIEKDKMELLQSIDCCLDVAMWAWLSKVEMTGAEFIQNK